MSCYICFEDLDPEDHSVVYCKNHDIHSGCYYIWFKTRGHKEISNCVICNARLTLSQKHKINGKELAIQYILTDDMDCFVLCSLFLMPTFSEEIFFDLVKKALSAKALKILTYLHDQLCHLETQQQIERYVLLVWATNSPLRVPMILGNLKLSKGLLNIPFEFDIEVANALATNGAFFELYCLWKNFFATIPVKLQRSVGVILFATLQRRLWKAPWPDVGSPNWTFMFRILSLEYPALSCYILGNLCPIVTLICCKSESSFFESYFVGTVSNCRKCNRDHMWEAVSMAVLFKNLEFLRILSESIYPFYSVPNNKIDDLIKLILKVPNPRTFKRFIDQCFTFKTRRKWTRIFNERILAHGSITGIEKFLLEVEVRIDLMRYRLSKFFRS